MWIWILACSVLFAGCAVLFFLWQRAQKQALQWHAQLATLHPMLQSAEQLRDDAIRNFQLATEQRHAAETRAELAERDVQRMQQQMADWEQTRQHHLEAAKAGMLQASMELSNKLLNDHKREAETQQKRADDAMKQTTEAIFTKYQSVVETMTTLNAQVQQLEVVRKAILTPSGAGALGEITLENILRASRLVEGQDYILQHTVYDGAENRLRPDAIIFLPQHRALVIDSKASKFVIEREQAAAESTQALAAMDAKLLARMREHITALSRKEYRESVQQQWKQQRTHPLAQVTLLMFVPSDSTLDTLRQLDADFLQKAYEQMILPVGPSGLMNVLLESKMNILTAQQVENTQLILDEVQALLSSIGTLHDHAGGMGKSLKSVVEKYDRFAASFNRTFLSKARKMQKLGVELPKGKALPQLEQYQLIANTPLVEGEMVESEESGESIDSSASNVIAYRA